MRYLVVIVKEKTMVRTLLMYLDVLQLIRLGKKWNKECKVHCKRISSGC